MSADLFAALAKANDTITNPSKDGKGNYGAYLTLDALLDHVRKPLAEQGLSIVQDVTTTDAHVQVVTTLLHASGDRLDFGPITGPIGQNWQQLGGAVTYARRYALCAALGISGDDDDDAQAHTDANPKRSNSTPVGQLRGPAAKAMTGPASDRQIGMIKGLMKSQHVTEYVLADFATEKLGFDMPVEGLNALTKGQASAIIEAMTGAAPGGERPATRSKPAQPDPDDPWATAPLVDPVTGEVVA